MKLKSVLSCFAIALGLALNADAANPADTIAVNFGANEAGGVVDGAAGIFGTPNWNNTEDAAGMAEDLVNGGGAATAAKVTWDSNGTWASTGRGEENNTAPPGNDRNLMTGYLDTGGLDGKGVTVTVSGLDFADPYSVVVYIKGGVNGRGGDYTISDENMMNMQTQSHTDVAAFDGTYVEGAEGDYLVFPGVTGASFVISTTPLIGGTARAPINGIEVYPGVIPEPSSIALICSGLLGFGLLRRKR